MTSIDFECALVSFQCERCNGSGEFRMSRHDTNPDWCGDCGGSGEHNVYIGTWLTNLAIGAALCRAWQLGVHINGAGWWYPGRGDEAPEFEGPTALDEDADAAEAANLTVQLAAVTKERDEARDHLAYLVGSPDEVRPLGIKSTIFDRLQQVADALGVKVLGDIVLAVKALIAERDTLRAELATMTANRDGQTHGCGEIMDELIACRAALVEALDMLGRSLGCGPGHEEWWARYRELRKIAEDA